MKYNTRILGISPSWPAGFSPRNAENFHSAKGQTTHLLNTTFYRGDSGSITLTELGVALTICLLAGAAFQGACKRTEILSHPVEAGEILKVHNPQLDVIKWTTKSGKYSYTHHQQSVISFTDNLSRVINIPISEGEKGDEIQTSVYSSNDLRYFLEAGNVQVVCTGNNKKIPNYVDRVVFLRDKHNDLQHSTKLEK